MKQGRRPKVTPEDVLEVIEDSDEPFLSTGEIVEQFDASKPTVRDRLQTLQDRGEVRSRVIGANSPAWYLPELEERPAADTDGGAEIDGGSAVVRKKALDAVDGFEEDLARVSVEALTIAEINLWRHLKLMGVAAFIFVVGFGGFLYGVFVANGNTVMTYGVFVTLTGFIFTALALAVFGYRYSREHSRQKKRSAVAEGEPDTHPRE